MARAPLDGRLTTSPHGGYGYTRTSKAQGACPRGYPCTHAGVDLVASKGTPVKAPSKGWLFVSAATDQPPFAGYGPAVVLLAHDDADDEAPPGSGVNPWTLYDQAYHDKADPGPLNPTMIDIVSHRYSLLAHLDPDSLTHAVDLLPWTEDDTHYSVQGADWLLLDPIGFGMLPGTVVHVDEGDVLGKIGEAGHVHWEMRRAPYETGVANTVDPIKDWLAMYHPLVNPPAVQAQGSIPWWLWLAVGVAITRRRR
jgi:murein DD-endopeptidase MepM/ murein hydrolase activator NlpD